MRFFAVFVALLLAVPARVRPEESPTNLDLVVAAVERAADDALAQAPGLATESAGAVVVAPQAPHAANWVLDHLPNVGIDIRTITKQLEEEGVNKFAASYDELLALLKVKCQATVLGFDKMADQNS